MATPVKIAVTVSTPEDNLRVVRITIHAEDRNPWHYFAQAAELLEPPPGFVFAATSRVTTATSNDIDMEVVHRRAGKNVRDPSLVDQASAGKISSTPQVSAAQTVRLEKMLDILLDEVRRQKLTVADLAKAGIDPAELGKILCGKQSTTFAFLFKMAEFLGKRIVGITLEDAK